MLSTAIRSAIRFTTRAHNPATVVTPTLAPLVVVAIQADLTMRGPRVCHMAYRADHVHAGE